MAVPSRALARPRQSARGLRRPGGAAGLRAHPGISLRGALDTKGRQVAGQEGHRQAARGWCVCVGGTSTVQGSLGAEGAWPGQWILLNKVLILWADMESGAGAQLLRRDRRGAEPPHPPAPWHSGSLPLIGKSLMILKGCQLWKQEPPWAPTWPRPATGTPTIPPSLMKK